MVLLNSHLNWSYVIGGKRQVRVAGFAVQECERVGAAMKPNTSAVEGPYT